MGVQRLSDLEIDLSRRTVSRRGEALAVHGLNFQVLAALVKAKGETLDPATLANEAWELEHVSDETLAKRIGLLREALADDARHPRYVRTVRGRGYALVEPAEPVRKGQLIWRRGLAPGATALAAGLAFLSLGALPAKADYALTLVDGETGAVRQSIVTERAGAEPVELIDPRSGDIVLRDLAGELTRRAQADTLVRLAQAKLRLGEAETAMAYARAALAVDPDHEAAAQILT